MPEGTTFICTNNSAQVLNSIGPRSRHTAQEGDPFCLLEMSPGAESANQSQNNSKGPCENAGGNRYKSIYIHSKTSPIST